jgi:hypothetical protein
MPRADLACRIGGTKPGLDLGQDLSKAWLVGGSKMICRPDVLVMRVSSYLRMVGRIIVAEDAIPGAYVCVGVVDSDGVAKLSTDNLVEV